MDNFSNSIATGLSRASHRRLEEAIAVASRLAGTDAIGAIHVTVPERPTYDELRLFRQIAACHGLTLTMTADSIVLRPKQIDPALTEGAPAGHGTGSTIASQPAPHSIGCTTTRRIGTPVFKD